MRALTFVLAEFRALLKSAVKRSFDLHCILFPAEHFAYPPETLLPLLALYAYWNPSAPFFDFASSFLQRLPWLTLSGAIAAIKRAAGVPIAEKCMFLLHLDETQLVLNPIVKSKDTDRSVHRLERRWALYTQTCHVLTVHLQDNYSRWHHLPPGGRDAGWH